MKKLRPKLRTQVEAEKPGPVLLTRARFLFACEYSEAEHGHLPTVQDRQAGFMKPRSLTGKREMPGNTVAMSASDTPNHLASVAEY